jgi:hypothetical protein
MKQALWQTQIQTLTPTQMPTQMPMGKVSEKELTLKPQRLTGVSTYISIFAT